MPIIKGIVCDKCERMIYWEGNTSKAITTSIARDKGWTIGKRCLCPYCRQKRRDR